MFSFIVIRVARNTTMATRPESQAAPTTSFTGHADTFIGMPVPMQRERQVYIAAPLSTSAHSVHGFPEGVDGIIHISAIKTDSAVSLSPSTLTHGQQPRL